MIKYFRLLGLIALGIILWKVDLASVGQQLRSCNLALVGAALGITFVAIAVKAIRWHLMMRILDINSRYATALQLYLSGIFLGIATPGRLGELARAVYAKEEFKADGSIILATVVMDRILDLYALAMVGIFACYYFQFAERLSAFFIVVTVLIFVSPIVIGNPRIGRKVLRYFILKTPVSLQKPDLVSKMESFFDTIGYLLGTALIPPIFLTFVSYCLFLSAGVILAISLHIQTAVVGIVSALGLAQLLSLVPVSVAGIGTRDAVFIICFVSMGLSTAMAISYSTLVLSVFYIGTGMMGAAVFFANPIYKTR